MTWHDLTHTIKAWMPVIAGDPPVSIQPCYTHRRDGFQLHELSLGTHSGTHLDAPRHFFPAGPALEDYPVGGFHRRGLVIDATGRNPNTAIGPEVLAAAGSYLAEAEIILFYTGWDAFFGKPEYFHHPYLSADLARALVTHRIGIVGVDTFSPDPAAGKSYPVHEILLGAHILIAENLTRLGALQGGPAEFWLLPLKVQAGDGAPIRAIGRRL